MEWQYGTRHAEAKPRAFTTALSARGSLRQRLEPVQERGPACPTSRLWMGKRYLQRVTDPTVRIIQELRCAGVIIASRDSLVTRTFPMSALDGIQACKECRGQSEHSAMIEDLVFGFIPGGCRVPGRSQFHRNICGRRELEASIKFRA